MDVIDTSKSHKYPGSTPHSGNFAPHCVLVLIILTILTSVVRNKQPKKSVMFLHQKPLSLDQCW